MGIALGIFIGLFVGFIVGVLIGAALALASEDMFLERLSEHADSFDSYSSIGSYIQRKEIGS